MDVETLRRSIDIIKDGPVELSAQSLTYLRTYQHLIDAVRALPHQQESLLSQVSVMAYGWMPRVARLDPLHIEEANEALITATKPEQKIPDEAAVSSLSNCLHSVVGTSKVLHFVRPDLYPIWDSKKVAKVWHKRSLSQNDMVKSKLYIDYTKKIHEMLADKEIKEFITEFNQAYSERLKKLNIPSYTLSPIRAIESAIFELSAGEYDDT